MVVLKEGLTTIRSDAFNGKVRITSVEFAGSITHIDSDETYGAFYDCHSMSSLMLQKTSIVSIGDRAFHFCSGITTATLPPILKTIGDLSFFMCTSLKSIVLLPCVETVGDGVFMNCCSLEKVDICSVIPITTGNKSFKGCNSLKSIQITSLESIGEEAFACCGALTHINLPSSTKEIGKRAFYFCHSLKSVKLSHPLTSIGEDSFGACISLPVSKMECNIPNDEFKALVASSRNNE